MTKVYKVTLMIVNHDDLGVQEIKDVIENVSYPNRCINPSVVRIETREVEWDDSHPLNKTKGYREAFDELFAGEGG